MHSDKKQQVAKYSIKSDFSATGKEISVLLFLEKYLPNFQKKFKKSKDDDEWFFNEALFGFLDIYSRNYAFQFIPEYLYKSKSRPDFGIKEVKSNMTGGYFYDQKAEHFFDIECKRLYDTTQSKQYVSGKTGGIQRFRENKHGENLPRSAMIGYVETEDFDFWHNKVNSWISDIEEHLEKIAFEEIAKFKSTHKRINTQQGSIVLLHFWLNIN